MKNKIKLNFLNDLEKTSPAYWGFIQIIIGPRQVGKTTGVLQYLELLNPSSYLYASADGPLSRGAEWLEQQWFSLKTTCPEGLLVIDEIQKVENWSETIKKLWDQQARSPQKLRLILLGSSSLEIQKSLSESLTGRFLLHKVHHWNFMESQAAYNLTFEQFLIFGGYPGSYDFLQDIPYRKSVI